MKIRSFFKRLILSNLGAALQAVGRGTGSKGESRRQELCFQTTDGVEIYTWAFSG